ncbi:hypothetical protein CVT25_011560 [Psilocybe cyanescens]|uniref:Uncharacterized protein n=1 Tax=Psilocybe cyanescens TaxID=93625 RepID=A0A409X0P9_PSICY|nr:hypothetical protein CVT25_011560 [Psilocybe cyanescens]
MHSWFYSSPPTPGGGDGTSSTPSCVFDLAIKNIIELQLELDVNIGVDARSTYTPISSANCHRRKYGTRTAHGHDHAQEHTPRHTLTPVAVAISPAHAASWCFVLFP